MTKFLSLEGLTTIIAKLKSQFAAKGEAIKSITGSGNKTLNYTRADGSTGAISYQDTTYGTGNTSTAGLTKLYTSLGTQSDGAPTNSLLNSQVSALNTALGNRIKSLEGDEDVFEGTAGNAADGFPQNYSGYWLATNDEPFVFKVTNGSPVQVATIGTFLFYDTPTGDWYIVDTGKSTTKVQTSITTSEINALF